MKKHYFLSGLFCCIAAFLPAQKISFVNINKTDVNLRGNPVVLGQITLDAPATGKVILRFDGQCLGAVGDRIVMAASDTPDWSVNDGSVELECASADINSNPFSHTRSYDVSAGSHTYYAVAENYYKMNGNGLATVTGTLTAEWFPEEPGKAFARHNGFYYENILVEGAPTAFNTLTIHAPVAGKALVRFDGKCVSNYGDLIFFAASNTPSWGSYDGSTSNEVISNTLNHYSFSHVRSYDIGPGDHTFYAVVENFYEIYGNGFASVYGSLTVEFYPDPAPVKYYFQPINTQFGVNIEGPPVSVGQIDLNAPVSGKVLVNFAGTCIASNGDQVRLAASDQPNWAPGDGNVQYEPFSSDHNRTSFSHSRVYDVAPGDHHYYAVIQNVEEFDGSGLAVVYGSLSAQFFPDVLSSTETPAKAPDILIAPNPALDRVGVYFPDAEGQQLSFALINAYGSVLERYEKPDNALQDHLFWDVSTLPSGSYFVKITSKAGTQIKPVLHLH